MSDPKPLPLLPALEKMLEYTAQVVRRYSKARAVMIVVVHEDATIQSTATVAPGMEARACSGLRSLADKIEKNENVRLEMPGQSKN